MTESERDEAANTLLNCIAAVFKQAKSRDPAAHPWIGAMLATEHLRQLGTSVFIQLTRRDGFSPHPKESSNVPAASQGRLDAKTAKDTSKPTKRVPRASSAAAGRGSFVCPACQETKTWAMDWGPFPNSVCVDCYKAGRTP